jgi:hypothetical protein
MHRDGATDEMIAGGYSNEAVDAMVKRHKVE